MKLYTTHYVISYKYNTRYINIHDIVCILICISAAGYSCLIYDLYHDEFICIYDINIISTNILMFLYALSYIYIYIRYLCRGWCEPYSTRTHAFVIWWPCIVFGTIIYTLFTGYFMHPLYLHTYMHTNIHTLVHSNIMSPYLWYSVPLLLRLLCSIHFFIMHYHCGHRWLGAKWCRGIRTQNEFHASDPIHYSHPIFLCFWHYKRIILLTASISPALCQRWHVGASLNEIDAATSQWRPYVWVVIYTYAVLRAAHQRVNYTCHVSHAECIYEGLLCPTPNVCENIVILGNIGVSDSNYAFTTKNFNFDPLCLCLPVGFAERRPRI